MLLLVNKNWFQISFNFFQNSDNFFFFIRFKTINFEIFKLTSLFYATNTKLQSSTIPFIEHWLGQCFPHSQFSTIPFIEHWLGQCFPHSCLNENGLWVPTICKLDHWQDHWLPHSCLRIILEIDHLLRLITKVGSFKKYYLKEPTFVIRLVFSSSNNLRKPSRI